MAVPFWTYAAIISASLIIHIQTSDGSSFRNSLTLECSDIMTMSLLSSCTVICVISAQMFCRDVADGATAATADVVSMDLTSSSGASSWLGSITMSFMEKFFLDRHLRDTYGILDNTATFRPEVNRCCHGSAFLKGSRFRKLMMDFSTSWFEKVNPIRNSLCYLLKCSGDENIEKCSK